MSNASRETVVKGKVTFSRIYKADFQKSGSKTLEVKQIIKKTSFYPGKKYNSSLQDELFSNEDFGAEEKEYKSEETRVAWINIPVAATEAEVKKMIAELGKEACIFKVISNSPIIDDNQKSAIANGFRTLDDYANAQAVRYGDNHETHAGELILHNDKVQYKRTFFSKTAKADQDLRDNGQIYVSPELIEELEGAGVYFEQDI